MMGFGNGLGNGFGGGLWVLGCILLVVGLVALAAWAVSRLSTHDHQGTTSGRPDALEILRERFARGEITEAEYTHAASVLGTER